MGKKKAEHLLPRLPAGVKAIDSHCHLDMIGAENELDQIVTRAAAAGVAPIITVGIDLESSVKAIRLAARYSTVYATVGIHPHNVRNLTDSTYSELARLCTEPKVVAYGEIGLDYVKQYAPRPLQLEHYSRQLDLAREIGLPLVIHDREAHVDILRLINDRGPFPAGGVMHCFSGDWHLARKVLDLGFFLSIPGVVTFNKAVELQEVARKAPLDRLLLETDAPFLAPEPWRGKKNFPEYVLFTAARIAVLRNLELEEVVRRTTANGLRLFKITSV